MNNEYPILDKYCDEHDRPYDDDHPCVGCLIDYWDDLAEWEYERKKLK